MKIAFVTQPWDSNLPSEGEPTGSIGILTHEMARRLAGKGHEVCIYGSSRSLGFGKRVERAHGVEFRSMRAVRLETKLFAAYQKAANKLLGLRNAERPRYASSLYLAGYGRQLAQALGRQNYDVIHVHNLFQLVPAIRAGNPTAKIVLHMHCEWLSQIAQSIIDKHLRHVDMVVGVSDHITDKVRKRFPDRAARCRTIYNGVDVDAFRSLRAPSPQRRSSPMRLLFVGRVSPEKGIHLLIEAFAKVAQTNPDVVLDILGPYAPTPLNFLVGLSDDEHVKGLAVFYEHGKGSYWSQIEARIPAALAGKVRLLGVRSYQETAAEYRNADIFVIASYSDAFPLPPLEAMASGLPVVAASVGGIKEQVVHGETGFLFDVGNADMMARDISTLLQQDTLRSTMGAAARQRALNVFSWDRVVTQLEDNYRELLR